MVTVRRIFIWKKVQGSQAAAEMSSADAHALADALRAAYASGKDPKSLVKDPNRVVLDSEPLQFRRGELPEKMEKPAFTIKEGEWVVLDDTSDSLVLLQLVKRSRLDLKDMTPSIAKKLQGEKLQAELDNLKKQSGIWLDQSYFVSAAKAPGSSAGSQTSGPLTSVPKGER